MSIALEYFKKRPFAGIAAISLPFLLICIFLMELYSPKITPENGFKSFILAFEFAKSPGDIELLFMNFEPVHFKILATGIYIDFGFMIAYSFLLALFFYKSKSVINIKWTTAGIPISVVIFLADFFENIILLKITEMIRSGADKISLPALLQKLHLITWTKWGGLAFAFLMLSFILFKGKLMSKIGAFICLSAFFLGVIAFNSSPEIITAFTLSVFASFGVLIFYSFIFRKTTLNE